MLAVTPGPRLRIKVEAPSSARRSTASSAWTARAGRRSPTPTTRRSRCRRRTAMPQSLILPDPIARDSPSRRDERDHPGPPRPGGPRRHRLPLPDRGRTARPDFELAAERAAGERPPGGHGRGRRDRQPQGIHRPDHGDRGRPARRPDRPPGDDRRRPDGGRAHAHRRRPTPPSPPPRSSCVGAGQGTGGPIERVAVKPVVFAQQIEPADQLDHRIRPGRRARPGDARDARRRRRPRSRSPTASARSIPVKVARTKGADGALAISAAAPAARA